MWAKKKMSIETSFQKRYIWINLESKTFHWSILSRFNSDLNQLLFIFVFRSKVEGRETSKFISYVGAEVSALRIHKVKSAKGFPSLSSNFEQERSVLTITSTKNEIIDFKVILYFLS